MHSSAKKRAVARVGTLLHGKWTLDTFLGYGGSAAVYAATHRNGKRAAVKILHAHCARDPELVARFVREGYLANKINHPGIVSVLDDDKADDGSAYLVMDLLDGHSFEDHGRGMAPPLSIVDALQIADDLLDILVAAHAIGLVHRDIKPANLFLTSSGQLKILDFGIARLAETFSEGVTQAGMLMGTPAFMPPEQARGRWHDVDARSDLWAVGVTISSLMTGRRPRTADTPAEELLAAMMQPMPSLATLLPDAPPQVVALVDRACAFERHDRWQSAAEMQRAVREARHALQGPAPFAPSTTLRFAPKSHATAGGDTTEPTLLHAPFSGGTLLTAPVSRPSAHDPDVAPSFTTNHPMMSSSAPAPLPSRKPSRLAAFGAGIGVLALLVLIAGGVMLARRRPQPTTGAREDAAATLGVSAAAQAVATGSQVSAATGATTATAAEGAGPSLAPTGADTASAATPSSTSSSQAAERRHDKRPKAKPTAPEASADPTKYFDNRF